MDDELIRRAETYARELFASDAGGHDFGHTMRVYRTAMLLADSEPGCDRTVTALAALLHDADDYKLFHTENNANARRFLAENGVPAETAERVIAAVNAVSFSRNAGRRPDTPEGCVVQDADRLDALGAVGIARTFAFGGEHDRYIRYVDRWYSPEEVAAQAMKDLKKKKSVSILGAPVRRQVRLVKHLSVDTVMDIWCRQQGIE